MYRPCIQADTPRLLQGCGHSILEVIELFVTIQVILPQSEMSIEGFGHIQIRANQGRALLFEIQTLLPLPQ